MFERLVRSVWAGEGLGARISRLLLLPVEGLFRIVVALRGHAYDRGWLRTRPGPVPVVSVGNLTVGGTGKTPVVAWIVRLLQQQGSRPAIVSRGHGKDELALHRRWNADVAVIAAPRRVEGVRRGAEEGATVCVLDDGFQHRAVDRNLDLVLVAAEQPFPGAMLPRGPYRESPRALRRAHLVVVTRKTASAARSVAVANRVANLRPNLPVVRVILAPGGWLNLRGEAAAAPGSDVLAVASIAAPETFVELVRTATGRDPELLLYGDHHAYVEADARTIRDRAGSRTVVTTEKDAVKLVAFEPILGDARVLSLEVRAEAGEGELRRALAGTLAGGGPA